MPRPVDGEVAPGIGGEPVDYVRDVKPIFAKHCVSCHGTEKQKGGLRLDRKADAFLGGNSGNVTVTINPAGLAPGPERGICQCRLVSILCMACHYPWTADDLLSALVRAGHLEPPQHVADGLLSAADRPQDGLAGVTPLQARLRAAQVLTEAGRAEDAIAIAIAPPAVRAAGGDADGSARMQASGVLAEAGAADEATALALAVAGERPGYAHVYLVAVSLWLAAYGYLPQATRLAAEAVADAARMRGSDGKFHYNATIRNWTSEPAS